jgi:hypothetical protein
MPHAQPHRRGALAAAVAVLALLALLPARWGRWANNFGNIASLLTAPVSSPAHSLVRLVMPRPGGVSEEVAALQADRDKWKQLFYQAFAENQRLRDQFDRINKGFLPSDQPVATLLRPVIGTSAEPGGQIKVRLERKDGVEVNTVATTPGVQLVGRVIEVGPRLCWVRLINDRSAGKIGGVIMAIDSEPGTGTGVPRGPKCLLSPVTNGLLQGYVAVGSGERTPARGQIVRLDDEAWPRSAQSLVIGTVDRVEPDATGRFIVTVRPTVELDRLSEVYLRVAQPEVGAGGGGAP